MMNSADIDVSHDIIPLECFFGIDVEYFSSADYGTFDRMS